MKNLTHLLLFFALLGSSCKSFVNGSKTAHEKYANKIEDHPRSDAWIAASEKALGLPYSIQLPYSQRGYFQAGTPRALGLSFSAKQGQRIEFNLSRQLDGNTIYADLFFQDGTEMKEEYSAGITDSVFVVDVKQTGNYVLRLQPELDKAIAYNLSVVSGPSIGFPVSGTKARTGSFWGASRDGGVRSHEGIDIFAPKLTPVVAGVDGYVTAVRDGGLGGKTVWQRADGKNISLYYAHLDKQLVKEGQFVKKGEVVGLVGNTGNAKNTPAHLHFGIYSSGGAVDPWPYVNQEVKKAPAVPSKEMAGQLKLQKALKIPGGTTVQPNTLLVPLAVNAKGYIAELPDGRMIQAPFTQVKLLPAATIAGI